MDAANNNATTSGDTLTTPYDKSAASNNATTGGDIQPTPYEKPPPGYAFTNPMVMQSPSQMPMRPMTYTGGQYPTGSNFVYAQPRVYAPGALYSMPPPAAADINDYMGWSIFNVLCCGLVFGIIAVMMSSQVQQRKRDGDLLGAKSLSTSTAIWNGISTLAGIGIIITVLVITMTSNKYSL